MNADWAKFFSARDLLVAKFKSHVFQKRKRNSSFHPFASKDVKRWWATGNGWRSPPARCAVPHPVAVTRGCSHSTRLFPRRKQAETETVQGYKAPAAAEWDKAIFHMISFQLKHRYAAPVWRYCLKVSFSGSKNSKETMQNEAFISPYSALS